MLPISGRNETNTLLNSYEKSINKRYDVDQVMERIDKNNYDEEINTRPMKTIIDSHD